MRFLFLLFFLCSAVNMFGNAPEKELNEYKKFQILSEINETIFNGDFKKFKSIMANYKKDSETFKNYGAYSLHVIVSMDRRINFLRYLLEKGIDPNSKIFLYEGGGPLHSAVSHRNYEAVKLLIQYQSKINEQNDLGNTPLHRSLDIKISEYLINKGAEVDAVNKLGETPLHFSVKEGAIENIKLLLKHGANIDVVSLNGYSIFHAACEGGVKWIIEIMLKKGYDINSVTKTELFFPYPFSDNEEEISDHVTGLYLAIKNNHLDIIKYLIEKGAKVNLLSKKGFSPLHFALMKSPVMFECVHLLVENGVDINAPLISPGNIKWTALHIAVYKNRADLIRYFIDLGINSSVIATNGENLIDFALKENKRVAVRILKEKGLKSSDIKGIKSKKQLNSAEIFYLKGDSQESLNEDLLELIRNNDNREIPFLIKLGADPDFIIKDRTEPYPLIFALNHTSDLKTIKALLDNGAKINFQFTLDQRNIGAYTMEQYSFEHTDEQLFEYVKSPLKEKYFKKYRSMSQEKLWGELMNSLKKQESNLTPLLYALKKTVGYKTTTLLVQYGANVNVKNDYGDTPLSIVLHNISFDNEGKEILFTKEEAEFVDLLIEKGTDVNLSGPMGLDCFVIAAVNGKLYFLKKYIDKYKNINNQNKEGNTLLHYACEGGKIDIVKFLVEKKINLNLQNMDKMTALEVALIHKQFDIAEYLIQSGINVNTELIEKMTALHIADLFRQKELVKLLLEKGAKQVKSDKGFTPLDFALKLKEKAIIDLLKKYSEKKK